jgi:hypothetical protein
LKTLSKLGKGNRDMGTGSFGSSGAGSGIRHRESGSGQYQSSGGQVIAASFGPKDMKKEVQEVLGELFAGASEYMKGMFANSYVRSVFAELFEFSRILRSDSAVRELGELYRLDVKKTGFILNLIDRLDAQIRTPDVEERFANTVRSTLELFFFKAVRDEYNVATAGTATQVVDAMRDNRDFWRSLSGHFLYSLASTVFQKEVERKAHQATFAVAKELETRTNAVIDSYEKLNEGRGINYRALLDYIADHWEWFRAEMIK